MGPKVEMLVPHLQRNVRMVPTPADVETAGSVTTVSELPLPVNLALYTGDDFTMQLTVTNPDNTPTDFTGAVVTSQIRPKANSNAITASFAVTVTTNVITLMLSNQQTQPLVGGFVWDCQVLSESQEVTTLAAGKVNFTQDVTR